MCKGTKNMLNTHIFRKKYDFLIFFTKRNSYV